MVITQTRNHSLDTLKCVASILIVFLHYNKVDGYYGVLYSDVVRAIARCAVPLFFMITGYYLPIVASKGELYRQVKKVVRLALGATAFYFSYRCVDALCAGELMQWLQEHYPPGAVFSWLILNDDPSGYHLWYLYGLLYSLIFYQYLYKVEKQGLISYITCAMFMLVVVSNYTGILFVRNYLLGIPCIGMGIMIRNNQLKLKDHILKLAILLCMVLIIVEMQFVKNWLGVSFDIYTLSASLSACLLIFGIKHPNIGKEIGISVIGMKYSAYIYIFHVFVDNIIGKFVVYDTVLLQIIRPFTTFGASLLFSILYVNFKNRIYGTQKI